MFLGLFTLVSSLTSVLNPIGAIPMFVSFTANRTEAERQKIALKCSMYVFFILIISFLAGKYILDFFGISLNSMKIGGGLILLLSGTAYLSAKNETHKGISRKIKIEATEKEDISFTPLAMPLLAGPGSMSYLISMNTTELNWQNILTVSAAILLVCLLTFILLYSSRYFVKLFSNAGLVALSRIMGFFVLCLGVELITVGLRNFIATL
ncbi:MAG: MarC family protein [Sediminibacterium sp.]|nr:MarC family protein [Sediminibacterium sp.]